MKILDLVLKHQWYDLIEVGIKTEEYRELKPYWIKRLMGCLKWCSIGCLYDKNEIEHCRRRKCENLTDLKEILEELGKITGETVTEDVIAEIFSKFCLGK